MSRHATVSTSVFVVFLTSLYANVQLAVGNYFLLQNKDHIYTDGELFMRYIKINLGGISILNVSLNKTYAVGKR